MRKMNKTSRWETQNTFWQNCAMILVNSSRGVGRGEGVDNHCRVNVFSQHLYGPLGGAGTASIKHKHNKPSEVNEIPHQIHESLLQVTVLLLSIDGTNTSREN